MAYVSNESNNSPRNSKPLKEKDKVGKMIDLSDKKGKGKGKK